MTRTFEGLREILVDEYEVPAERVSPQTPLEDIDIDSLATMELIFSLEEKFGVKAEETAREFRTLGDVASYIEGLMVERDPDSRQRGSSASR